MLLYFLDDFHTDTDGFLVHRERFPSAFRQRLIQSLINVLERHNRAHFQITAVTERID